MVISWETLVTAGGADEQELARKCGHQGATGNRARKPTVMRKLLRPTTEPLLCQGHTVALEPLKSPQE